MVIGIVCAVSVILIFAYIVYSNEKRKKKEGKSSDKAKDVKVKPEKVKKEKVKKEKPKKKKDDGDEGKDFLDTDDMPNFDNLSMSNGEIEDIMGSSVSEKKAEQKEIDDNFMKQELDAIFNPGKNDSSDDDEITRPRLDRAVPVDRPKRPERRVPTENSTEPSSDEVEEWAKYVLDSSDNASLSDKIKNLPPEIKAMIITNILDRKDY